MPHAAPSAIGASYEERQIDGNYGEIFHEGHYQGDFRDFTGRIAIERRELPRAGTNGVVYRRGRIAREGTLRVAKVDSRFEELFITYINKSTEQRRADRARGTDSFPVTELIIKLNDPESWGVEEIQLLGVRFWEIGIGFTMNDMLERDVPVTWTSEKLVTGIARPDRTHGGPGGTGWAPPAGEQTWGAATGSQAVTDTVI